MEKETSKKSRKNAVIYVLFALPILIGIIFYVVTCSKTPNYKIIYNNQIIDNAEAMHYYQIDETNTYISTSLVKNGGVFETRFNEKNLFEINLDALKKANSNFQKFALRFSFSADNGLKNKEVKQYPVIEFKMDNKTLEKISLSNSAFTEYKTESIEFSNSDKINVNLGLAGLSSTLEQSVIQFKELRIVMLGAY